LFDHNCQTQRYPDWDKKYALVSLYKKNQKIKAKKAKKSRTPYVNLQFILMSHNEHEIKNIRSIANELKSMP